MKRYKLPVLLLLLLLSTACNAEEIPVTNNESPVEVLQRRLKGAASSTEVDNIFGEWATQQIDAMEREEQK